MEVKGINYDAGIRYSSAVSTRDDLNKSTMVNEMGVIKNELHCNAVKIYGDNLGNLVKCSKIALREGLKVWFSPRLIDASFDEALKFIIKCSWNAEQLRKSFGNVVFVIGTEFSLDAEGFIEGETINERAANMFKPISIIKNSLGFGINKELNNFLSLAVTFARQEFNGEITYASGHWENVNWDLFDIISINYYRNKYNAWRYQKALSRIVRQGARQGKKTAITEFGCCSYKGADDISSWGYSIVDRTGSVPRLKGLYERDEDVQAKYITDLLKIYDKENVYASFVFNFITPDNKYNVNPKFDLDMANYGIVKVLPDKVENGDIPYKWERKKAFYELSKFYSGH